MTLDSLIMFTGAFVAALPFLGFPYSWDNVLLFIAGVFIVALGIVVRRRGVYPPKKSEVQDMPVQTYADSTDAL